MGMVSRHPAALAAMVLTFLVSGCAGIEQTFRDANGLVNEVIDLHADAESREQKAPLYAIEDRVEEACGPLFESANQRMTGGGASMLTQVSALFTSPRCRSTVTEARQALDRYRKENAAASEVEVRKTTAF